MARRRNCRCPRLAASNEPQSRSDVGMRCLVVSILITVAFTAVSVQAQQAQGNIPDITGSWERARDASIPAQPQPPLKAQYLKEFQARAQAVREANAKGEPIAERVVMCLPDGMPGMLSGPF